MIIYTNSSGKTPATRPKIIMTAKTPASRDIHFFLSIIPSKAHCYVLIEINIICRVLVRTIFTYFEMKVRSGAVSGTSNVCNNLTFCDFLTGRNFELTTMRIKSFIAVSMVDFNHVSVAATPT